MQCSRIVHDYFRRMGALHINEKELVASEYAVLSLAKPRDTVRVLADNSAALFYLLKSSGRLPHFVCCFAIASNTTLCLSLSLFPHPTCPRMLSPVEDRSTLITPCLIR